MTTRQVLTAEKRMKVTIMGMTVMSLTLADKMTYVMSFLRAFINSDDEDTNDRPDTTRSRQAITRRSEIDFSFF